MGNEGSAVVAQEVDKSVKFSQMHRRARRGYSRRRVGRRNRGKLAGNFRTTADAELVHDADESEIWQV